MSLTSDFSRPPKAFIDTTVLCGAIRKDGLNRKLLKLARSSLLYQPVLSKVCLLEFIRNALDGLGKGKRMLKYNEEAEKIASSQEMSEPLYRFDQDDFHVWVTAIEEECDYIVTTNTRRFPAKIGSIQRIHPRDFFNLLILE